MRPSGEWDIKLRKKIKSSLSIKVFLWVFSALTVCSMLIYGMLLTVLPRKYQIAADRKLDANTENFVLKLHDLPYEEAVNEIYNFCIQNNVTASLSDGKEAMHFGEIGAEKWEGPVAATVSTVTAVTFSDREMEYSLAVSSISQTADVILTLMVRFLPVVLMTIVLLSFFSALICSRRIVTPIAKISQISRRMTALDKTWKCEVERTDEIGVLASSLNAMAGRLQGTMEELKHFFAAVSHELKTPLTILKGQIENMILGYGDYRNHEKYLPEALKAAEDIEHLVKEMTAISKIECMGLQERVQEVSLMETVDDLVEAVLPLAQEKGIQIHQDIPADQILSVSPSLWKKALSNVIGNAVRHSPCGEEVFISFRTCEQGNALVIENTGVFIPEADLPHMFTPFYRADKSRSKATGGSGLGLYLVKTILDLHGMAYAVKNTERGVAFFVYPREERRQDHSHEK